MDGFGTIRLHKKVIEKFKKYSKTVSTNYSETLDYMIAFFKDNHLSPYDTLGMIYTGYVNQFNKRMDALISILRNIEKTQLIPTREMLESLFEGMKDEEPLYIERTQEEIENSKTEEEKLIDYYSNQYEITRKELFKTQEKLLEIENKLVYIKNTFGTSYYKLNITSEKYKSLFSNK